MKFKELTDSDKAKIKEVYLDKSLPWDERMTFIKEFFNKSERTSRKWLVKLGLKNQKNIEPEQYQEAKKRKLNPTKKRFLVTWGQNATSPHTKFLDNMEAYADFINGEIICIAGRYKNLSLYDTKENDEYWDDRLLPYLDANRHNIHKYLSVMSDIKIQPTAVNPMSGMEGMSKGHSCIFGHPKVHMKTIPVLEGYTPKMILTTGSVTKMNYSDSKAGKKSEFHHQFGFVIVEIENDEIFHMRQVTANDSDGSFYDLYYHVKNGVVNNNNNIEGIVLGDLHYGKHDEKVLEKSFNLLNNLKPKHVVLHDVFNGESISHHTIDNPFKQYGMEVNNKNSLKDEINNMINGLSKFKKFKNVIIVKSNHDTHLDKFLLNDWRKLPTPKNSIEYMEYGKMLLNQYKNGNNIGVIPEIIKNEFPKYITLNYNESYTIKGYEVGLHGDIGANGSRGSATQFRRLNTKMIAAHTHSPSRFDNVLYSGTSTKLRLSYNNGPSGWLQSHVIIFPNGKAQHINFIGKNKSYTTFK